MKTILAVLLISIVSTTTHASNWSGSGKVLEIYPSSSNSGILINHEFMIDPNGLCGTTAFYILDKNQMFFSEIFSLLMSAQARGSDINLHINGCAGANNNYPSITLAIAK